jgi:CIC family chloride channel protein
MEGSPRRPIPSTETRDSGTSSASSRPLAGHLRHGELGLLGLGLVSGVLAGLFSVGLLAGTRLLHLWLYGVPLDSHLSSLGALQTPFQAAIPIAGGVLVGTTAALVQRWRPHRPTDPIEANALRGGKMSLRDSIRISAETVVSNGFGASVGLEAAYTQMGSGFASWLGARLRPRRADMRMLVACGSAGAIAAAFSAPLTGTFYAFELILGTYTPFALAPVGAAAIGGVTISRTLGMKGEFMGRAVESTLSGTDIALLLGLGVACAAFGVAIMRGVALVETIFQCTRLPRSVHPALGGLVVGALALVTPQVLGSGHGGLHDVLFHATPPAVGAVALVLAAKAIASAVSLGSGFRGGLFFASLFLGALLGDLYAAGLNRLLPHLAPDSWVCAVTGMAALAVAIVGGPLTMSFLALETTGDFQLGVVMLAIASIVSVLMRRWFGYSFATWRLHLRGETIRSAQDVGWMRDLTVGRLMRTDVPQVPADMPTRQFIEEYPLGGRSWVVAVDPHGRYSGMIFGPDVHLSTQNGDASSATIARVARWRDVVLLPQMNVTQAAQLFEKFESEALPVVESESDRKVIGVLTEAHLLRRYAAELDTARRDLSDEIWTGRS